MLSTFLGDDQKPWRILLLISAVISTGICCTLDGAYAADKAQAAQTAAGKISSEQATRAALEALPGKVTDVTIEKKRGKTVYVIEIVAEKDGAETDVLVDMDSGKVLGLDR
jgi:uncharacterized membrane protein YkoI